MQKYRDRITATVIADSISADTGIRMTTLEITYPRFILAELNTHRMLSKNSASSRAIPILSMLAQIVANPAGPVHWGKNQGGMQAKQELTGIKLHAAQAVWRAQLVGAAFFARLMSWCGVHKQITNRITESGMVMKTVISGTEWANLIYLRAHPDAQPEFRDLAEKIEAALAESTPKKLFPGEWHVPYIQTSRDSTTNELIYTDSHATRLSVEEARIISASCCAQVSYRKSDDTLEKAKKIFRLLIESKPCHASPVEHQATPMSEDMFSNWSTAPSMLRTAGVTHQDTNGMLWSGNLRGWVQFRKTIPDEAKW